MKRKIQDIPLSEFEFSQRASNCLTLMNITTLEQLANADGKTLESGKNVGTKTLREFVRACVSCAVVPQWLNDVRLVLTPVYMEPADFVPLAGPYALTERWQLELAIAQLGNVPWVVLLDDSGLTLCRERKGYKEVGPEE